MNEVDCLTILVSSVCRCGRAKKRRQVFCGRCFGRLKPATKIAVMRSALGAQFEATYNQALKELEGRTA